MWQTSREVELNFSASLHSTAGIAVPPALQTDTVSLAYVSSSRELYRRKRILLLPHGRGGMSRQETSDILNVWGILYSHCNSKRAFQATIRLKCKNIINRFLTVMSNFLQNSSNTCGHRLMNHVTSSIYSWIMYAVILILK